MNIPYSITLGNVIMLILIYIGMATHIEPPPLTVICVVWAAIIIAVYVLTNQKK